MTAMQLNPQQIEEIVDRIVPLIAAPDDYEFFKGILFCKAESSTASEFGALVSKLLKAA